MKKILFGITWFLSSFVLMVYISYIERSKDNNFLEDFLYKTVVLEDNIAVIYIGVAIPFIAFYMFKPHWFSTPKNIYKKIFQSIEDKLFLSVKVVDETTLKFKADYSKDEEFERKWKDGKIHDIIKEFKKELKDKKIEKTNGFKIEFLNEHDFVRKDNVDIRIKIIEKELQESKVDDENYEAFIGRLEEELNLDYEESIEDKFVFKGDLDDEESDFYRKNKKSMFKFEDELPKKLKEIGKNTDVRISLMNKKKNSEEFTLELTLTKREVIDGATTEMLDLTDILQISDRYNDNPELLKIERDKNEQLHLHYEKLPTIDNHSWVNKMKTVKNLFNLNPQIVFNDNDVEIALYENLKSIGSFGNKEFMKHLKQGFIHLGINQKQDQTYLDLVGLKHFIFGAGTGGGKGVEMQLMVHSATYQIGTKTIASSFIIDPKGNEMNHYEGLDKDIHTFMGYEEIPYAIFCMEVEFEARRMYLKKNNLRKFFENFCLIFFDEFDQINKVADEMGSEYSEYCFMILKRVLQLGRSYGTKVLLTSQDLTAETIPTVFRSLFEDRMVGKTLEAYHASVLVDSNVYESFGYENTKNLTTGQFIYQTGLEANTENHFIQSYFSEANPNIQGEELCRYKEVYEKGQEELEQDRSFERNLDEYKIEVLNNMLNSDKTEEFKIEYIHRKLEEMGVQSSKTVDVAIKDNNDEDYDDLVFKGAELNQPTLIEDVEDDVDDFKDYQSSRKKRLSSFIDMEDKKEKVEEINIKEKDDKDIDDMFEKLKKKRKSRKEA